MKGWREKKAGRDNPAILGDALEALIGYIYQDLGIETAKEFILKYIYPKKNTIALVGSKSWDLSYKRNSRLNSSSCQATSMKK